MTEPSLLTRHRIGPAVGGAGVVQSALGNMPELFVALFALNQGLVTVVQSALVGSILANSVLVLGLAFLVGGSKNGVQRFSSTRTRMVSTLTLPRKTYLHIHEQRPISHENQSCRFA